MVLQPFLSVVETYREQGKGKNDDTIILSEESLINLMQNHDLWIMSPVH